MIEADSALGTACAERSLGNPYPGLRPFGEEDSDLFFGREREIATVLKLLEERQLVAVHGASGCGKSSIVRAGVVPVFRLDALANDMDARVIIIRPADRGGPLQSLARKLEREFPRAVPPFALNEATVKRQSVDEVCSWPEILTSSPDCTRDISEAVRAAGATLCLIVDQFEEIFAVHRDGKVAEAARLIELLITLGEPAPAGTALGERPLSVILTMRSDYLGQCALWDGFAEAVNRSQYLLPKISTLGLLRAIHEPARLCGGTVSEAAADRLLPLMSRDVDGLPILQHALMRSWRLSQGEATPAINIETFAAIGGLESALSRHAEEAFMLGTRDDPERIDAANWIFRALSDLDTDGRVVRRSVSFSDLVMESGAPPEVVDSILDVFRGPEFSLVTPFAPEPLIDGCIISVSHEALLRQWKRINDLSFDERGRPRGLVHREFQDGMIARALSVQAETFVKEQKGELGPAATEQRLPWYYEVRRRPGWITRYPLQRGRYLRDDVSKQWGNLAALMEASEANLVKEKSRLWAEQEMVARLRRSRAVLLTLSAMVVMLTALAAAFWIDGQRREAREQAEIAFGKIKLARISADIAGSQVLRLKNAYFMAQRECAGRDLAGDKCPADVYERFFEVVQRENATSAIDPDTRKPISMSPYFGYVGGVSPTKR